MTAPNAVRTIVVILLYIVAGGCNPDVETLVPPPDPAIEPPLKTGSEVYLQGAIAEIPEVWVVPSRQSKADLAQTLKTTVDQFDWVNPGLPDPVLPNTLVVIPSSYRLFTSESLSSISDTTGHSQELLQTINPKLAATDELLAGSILAMPQVVVIQRQATVEEAADALDLSGGALLSANPNLLDIDMVEVGTVLVMPPGGEEDK